MRDTHAEPNEDFEGIAEYDPTTPEDTTGDDYQGCGNSYCSACGDVDENESDWANSDEDHD